MNIKLLNLPLKQITAKLGIKFGKRQITETMIKLQYLFGNTNYWDGKHSYAGFGKDYVAIPINVAVPNHYHPRRQFTTNSFY